MAAVNVEWTCVFVTSACWVLMQTVVHKVRHIVTVCFVSDIETFLYTIILLVY